MLFNSYIFVLMFLSMCLTGYFPQLIAGPIVTHDQLIPQLMDEDRQKADFL